LEYSIVANSGSQQYRYEYEDLRDHLSTKYATTKTVELPWRLIFIMLHGALRGYFGPQWLPIFDQWMSATNWT
jgi:hypothetical protein